MRSLLAEFISRYQTLALRYIGTRIPDPETATDIYQNVMRAILDSGREFASPEHLRNYFFVAVRNATVDHLRSRARNPEVRLTEESALAGVARTAENPQEQLIAAEDLLDRQRRLARLREAMAELSEPERRLLRWRFWDRRTFREIKEETDTAISTLKSREDAILRKLQKAVRDETPEEKTAGTSS